MKKFLFILLAAVLFFAVNTSAQIQFGLKAGVNISNFNGSDAGDLDSRTGFLGGAFFAYDFNDMFSIQPEAFYSMKGAKQTFTDLGETITGTFKLDYIEIPVLIKLNIPLKGGSTVKPSIFAGPALGIKVASTVEVESGGQSASSDVENVSSTDFGFVFGGALGFDVSGHELGFDVRYNLGLTSVFDSALEADVKNSVISIAAYFGFN